MPASQFDTAPRAPCGKYALPLIPAGCFLCALLFASFLGAAPPSWFVSPPESENSFFFLAYATSTDKQKALTHAKRKAVKQASSYVGKYFDRKYFDISGKAFDKDINTNIQTCYILAKYPRGISGEKKFIDDWNLKETNKFFKKTVRKVKKLRDNDRIIDAIREISYAASDTRLPAVKKEELSNMLKDLITRVKIKPLDYSRSADTSAGMQGQIGVLVNVMGEKVKPIRGLKVDFSFTSNSGFFDKPFAVTDAKGLAAVKVMRVNNPGAATIEARISNEKISEFSRVQPAIFSITVKGRRIPITKQALPFTRGEAKKQNIILMKDNEPAGILELDFALAPEEIEVSAKVAVTKDVSGFSLDKQVSLEGVSLEDSSQSVKIAVDKAQERKKYPIKIKPFEIGIYITDMKKEQIKHPLKGKINTFRSLIINYIVYYL